MGRLAEISRRGFWPGSFRFAGWLALVWSLGVSGSLLAAASERPALSPVDSLTPLPQLEVSYRESEFFPAENRVLLRGHVNLIYQEVSLTADEVLIDLDAQQAEAQGNVVLWRSGQQWFGRHLVYDFANDRMRFLDTSFDGQWVFVKAPEVEIEERGKQVVARNAKVTTCDLPVPHYHFEAGRVELTPGERFSVYNSWLKLGRTPVAYVPYFTRSLDPEDPTWISMGGYSKRKGAFALNKLAWTTHDYLHLRLYGDYYSELGPGVGLKNRYQGKEPDNLAGFLYAYYLDGTDDNDFIQGPPETASEVEAERWKIAGKHWQRFGERTTLSAWYQALSDEEFNEDFDDEERLKGFDAYDLNYERNSFVNLAHRGEHYNYRATAKAGLNDFYLNTFPEEERLPQLRIDGLRRRLFDTPLYFKTGLEVARFNLEQELRSGPNALEYRQEADRADFDFELSYPIGLPAGLQLIPAAGYQGTYYSDPSREYRFRDREGGGRSGFVREEYDDLMRNVGRVGAELAATLQGVWETKGSERYSKMRMVSRPRVGFFYREPDVNLEDERPAKTTGAATLPLMDRLAQEGFPGLLFDERDRPLRTEAELCLSLDTRLEAKLRSGGTRSLARHSFQVAYDFELDDDSWTELISELWIVPFPGAELRNYVRYDLNEDELSQSDTALTLWPWERLRTSVGLATYDLGEDFDRQEELYLDLFCRLSKKYALEYRHRRDLDESRTRENRLTLTRDLHDLLASFIVREKNYDDAEHELEFKLVVVLKLPGSGKRYGLLTPPP